MSITVFFDVIVNNGHFPIYMSSILFFLYSMKFKRILLLLAFTGLPSFAAYQQQGFSQFQELD